MKASNLANYSLNCSSFVQDLPHSIVVAFIVIVIWIFCESNWWEIISVFCWTCWILFCMYLHTDLAVAILDVITVIFNSALCWKTVQRSSWGLHKKKVKNFKSVKFPSALRETLMRISIYLQENNHHELKRTSCMHFFFLSLQYGNMHCEQNRSNS